MNDEEYVGFIEAANLMSVALEAGELTDRQVMDRFFATPLGDRLSDREPFPEDEIQAFLAECASAEPEKDGRRSWGDSRFAVLSYFLARASEDVHTSPRELYTNARTSDLFGMSTQCATSMELDGYEVAYIGMRAHILWSMGVWTGDDVPEPDPRIYKENVLTGDFPLEFCMHALGVMETARAETGISDRQALDCFFASPLGDRLLSGPPYPAEEVAAFMTACGDLVPEPVEPEWVAGYYCMLMVDFLCHVAEETGAGPRELYSAGKGTEYFATLEYCAPVMCAEDPDLSYYLERDRVLEAMGVREGFPQRIG